MKKPRDSLIKNQLFDELYKEHITKIEKQQSINISGKEMSFFMMEEGGAVIVSLQGASIKSKKLVEEEAANEAHALEAVSKFKQII